MTKTESYTIDTPKETLLKIAEAVFAQYSFAGATIRLIAERSGMSSAMISYYFGSKEALYLQIFESHLTEVSDEIKLFERLDFNPFEKLRSYLVAYIERIASNRSFHQLVRSELVTVQHPAIITRLLHTRNEIYNFLLGIIGKGVAEGYFTTADEQLLALNILGLVPALFTEHLPVDARLNEPAHGDFTRRIVNYIMSALVHHTNHPFKIKENVQ